MTRAFVVALGLLCAVGFGSPGRLHGQGQEAFVAPWLDTALRQGTAEQRHAVWVYFRDKGPQAAAPRALSAPVTARAVGRRARRARAGGWTSYQDQAVARSYTEQVAARVTKVRHTLRWLNAMSVEATPAQVRALARLPFVERLDAVRRYRGKSETPVEALDTSAADAGRLRPRAAAALDYGTALDQLAQIRVPELHERGLTGEGVLVALFDSGFPNLEHEAFSAMQIVAQRDFVRRVDTVRDSTHSHGTATLSVVGGFRPGELIGPAFGASFILAVTEDASSETPIEEDNWAAAAEWAEAMGADVISSSLGYAQFDLPYSSYSERDMDGATAVTTIAATMAAVRGVVVVNSAGNGGLHPLRNTLVAPADGLYVLSAGAVDRAGLRASFSSVGPTADGRIKPDVAALGALVKVATTGTTRSYGFASGTSFSCPLTAGVVALLLQAHPTYVVDDVLLALRSTSSQSAAPDNLLGWGILDAVAAVDLELLAPGEPPADSGVPRRSSLAP
jgi:serine protease AprX